MVSLSSEATEKMVTILLYYAVLLHFWVEAFFITPRDIKNVFAASLQSSHDDIYHHKHRYPPPNYHHPIKRPIPIKEPPTDHDYYDDDHYYYDRTDSNHEKYHPKKNHFHHADPVSNKQKYEDYPDYNERNDRNRYKSSGKKPPYYNTHDKVLNKKNEDCHDHEHYHYDHKKNNNKNQASYFNEDYGVKRPGFYFFPKDEMMFHKNDHDHVDDSIKGMNFKKDYLAGVLVTIPKIRDNEQNGEYFEQVKHNNPFFDSFNNAEEFRQEGTDEEKPFSFFNLFR